MFELLEEWRRGWVETLLGKIALALWLAAGAVGIVVLASIV